MTKNEFIVPPKSWKDIALLSAQVRKAAGLASEPYFPIMEFIELVLDNKLNLVSLEVVAKSEMNAAEGFTYPDGSRIELREDVYRGAYAGNPRDRFTAAHELGHFLMHTNVPLARVELHQIIEPYRSSEAQADQFAAEVLMPAEFFTLDDTVEAIMKRHGTSHAASLRRMVYLSSKMNGAKKRGLSDHSNPLSFSALGKD